MSFDFKFSKLFVEGPNPKARPEPEGHRYISAAAQKEGSSIVSHVQPSWPRHGLDNRHHSSGT